VVRVTNVRQFASNQAVSEASTAMKTIFLSYSRQNQAQVRALAEDIEALGHQPWMDEALSGGQVWWDQILERVRASDVFLSTVAPESLKSEACRRELAYAMSLGKPVVPVLVADGVSPNLLPPQLASLQLIDHRGSNRESALQLGRVFTNLPPTQPLPDPLPAAPQAPLSYLGTLTERIDSDQPLDLEAQSTLLVDIKRALRDPESAEDGRTLLLQFRRRRDLFAVIAEELDELLRSAPRAPTRAQSQPHTASTTAMTGESVEHPQQSKLARFFLTAPSTTTKQRVFKVLFHLSLSFYALSLIAAIAVSLGNDPDRFFAFFGSAVWLVLALVFRRIARPRQSAAQPLDARAPTPGGIA
jgi:hypothetical protein